MALSMDEQRVLAEIERRLAAEDPGLAACMTAFKRPGPAAVLRSPRARILGSLFTVLLVAMISLMVYAMIPFRGHTTKAPGERSGTVPGQTYMSSGGAASAGFLPARTPDTRSASTGTGTGTRTGTTAPASATTGAKNSGTPATGSSHHPQSHSSYP